MMNLRTCTLLLLLAACRRDAAPAAVRAAPQRVQHSDLPPWFGNPDAPAQRIAGHLFSETGPLAGTVYLRMDAPDTSLWDGAMQQTTVDGAFDFGELRAGAYTLVATAAGQISRVVSIDTTTKPANTLSLYAHACIDAKQQVFDEDGAHPLAGVDVEYGGVVLASSDLEGRFKTCLPKKDAALLYRANGYQLFQPWFHSKGEATARLETANEQLRGRVLQANGQPAVGVGVQPIAIRRLRMTHVSPFAPLSIAATTDAQGNFVIEGLATKDQDLPPQYYVRVIDRTRSYEDEDAVVTWSPTVFAEVHVTKVEPGDSPRRPFIAGIVQHQGRPLPDAKVSWWFDGLGSGETWTAADGTFELGVLPGPMNLRVYHPTGLSSKQTINLALGEHRRGVVIDVAPLGTPFDEHGLPNE